MNKITSLYKGVSKVGDNRWCARIKVNYQTIRLGYYLTEEDAAKAYDHAARKAWSEFARVNFPDNHSPPTERCKWNVRGENHCRATVTAEQVRAMRKLYDTGKYTQQEIAEIFQIPHRRVSYIINRQTWKCVE